MAYVRIRFDDLADYATVHFAAIGSVWWAHTTFFHTFCGVCHVWYLATASCCGSVLCSLCNGNLLRCVDGNLIVIIIDNRHWNVGNLAVEII